MNSIGGDRAITPLIGFIILFGFLIVLMSIYQVTVIPTTNMETELKHNTAVQQDILDLRAVMTATSQTGDSHSVSVSLGTYYQSRSIFINPPPPTGTLRTIGMTSAESRLTVMNAKGFGDAADFWDGDSRAYPTGGLEYAPQYTEYQNAPTTVYENTVVVNRFDTFSDPLSQQVLIDDRKLFLVTVNGSVQATGQTVHPLDVRMRSASATTVVLSNDGAPIRIEIPTTLRIETWQSLLNDELSSTGKGGHVSSLSMAEISDSPFDLLTITLEPGITYELRMAKIGVGQGSTSSDLGYVRVVDGNNSRVPLGGGQRLEAELRDNYNNPAIGKDLLFVSSDGQFADGSSSVVQTTDEDGTASVVFTPDDAGDATVHVGVDTDSDGDILDESPPHRSSFRVEVRDTGS